MRVAMNLAARYIGDREEDKRRSCMRRKMMKNIYPDKNITWIDMKIKKQGIRKAVAGILAFIIGISIVIVTIVPLLIYLNTSSGEAMRAFNSLSEYQKQRSSESIDIVLVGGTPYIKNTGSTPLTIVLAVIDSGNGCGDRTSMLKTNITMKPGDAILSINATSNSYVPAVTCYVMTARGNVFPVKEKYDAILSQLALSTNTTGIISPDNTIFAQDMISWNQSGKIRINYSINSYNCNNNAIPIITYIQPYPRQVLTLKENNQLKMFELKNNSKVFICFKFNDVLNLTQQGYAVLALLRLVVVGSDIKTNGSFIIRLDISVNGSIIRSSNYYNSSPNFISWLPKTGSDYLIWDVIMLIPLKQGGDMASPGVYSLEIDVILDQINGNGSYYVGIEYLSIQGMKLIV